MTEVSSATSTATARSAAALAEQTAASKASAQTDYEDFLTLLVAQLENQDPLQPLDSTQFVDQLATLSQVEQAIGMNDRLDTLIASTQGEELAQLAGWIGREVSSSEAGFSFDGSSPISVRMPADTSASSASLVVKNSEGDEVAAVAADVNGGEVTWDGRTTDGSLVSSGLYHLSFSYSYEQTETTGERNRTVKLPGTGVVSEARLGVSGAELVLDTGAVISSSNITSVSNPS